jgi:thymidylate kinase
MKTRLSVVNATIDQIAGGHHEENGHKPDVPALLAFWKKNKYPLLVLNNSSLAPELISAPEFRAALNEESVIHDSLKAEYNIVREHWERAGIRSLLIKSSGGFPSFPYTSDNLDVLINEKDEAAARDILREEGYAELKNIEEPQKFLFRKFSEGESVSAIHLHTQVGWLVGFMDEKALWERSQAAPDDASIIVPSAEDIILITVAHAFYENKRFRFSDIMKVRERWNQGTIDWAYMEKVATHRGWLDGLHFCLLLCAHLEDAIWGETAVPKAVRESWEASLKRMPYTYRFYQKTVRRAPGALPFYTSFFFSKLLYYKKIFNDKNPSFAVKIYDTLLTLLYGIKLKARINLHPSYLISFTGPDGSGKTVHAQNLEKSLIICALKSKYYWNRTATSGFIRFFSTIIKRLKHQAPKEKETKPGAAGRVERLHNPLLRFVWTYLAAADMVWSYVLKVRLPMLSGKIVVCDRYVFDAAAEMECSLPPHDRLNRLAIKLMLALSPKPAIAYYLDVPDKVCAERKAEDTDPDYLRRQREAYDKLIKRYNLRVKKSDKNYKIVTDELTLEALNAYYASFEKRFVTRLSSLFVFKPNK